MGIFPFTYLLGWHLDQPMHQEVSSGIEVQSSAHRTAGSGGSSFLQCCLLKGLKQDTQSKTFLREELRCSRNAKIDGWTSGLCYLPAAKSTPPNFSESLSIQSEVWWALKSADASLPAWATEHFWRYWLNLKPHRWRFTCWEICSAFVLTVENRTMKKYWCLGEPANIPKRHQCPSWCEWLHIHRYSSALAYKLVKVLQQCTCPSFCSVMESLIELAGRSLSHQRYGEDWSLAAVGIECSLCRNTTSSGRHNRADELEGRWGSVPDIPSNSLCCMQKHAAVNSCRSCRCAELFPDYLREGKSHCFWPRDESECIKRTRKKGLVWLKHTQLRNLENAWDWAVPAWGWVRRAAPKRNCEPVSAALQQLYFTGSEAMPGQSQVTENISSAGTQNAVQ